jgi:hypothetical protein
VTRSHGADRGRVVRWIDRLAIGRWSCRDSARANALGSAHAKDRRYVRGQRTEEMAGGRIANGQEPLKGEYVTASNKAGPIACRCQPSARHLVYLETLRSNFIMARTPPRFTILSRWPNCGHRCWEPGIAGARYRCNGGLRHASKRGTVWARRSKVTTWGHPGRCQALSLAVATGNFSGDGRQ